MSMKLRIIVEEANGGNITITDKDGERTVTAETVGQEFWLEGDEISLGVSGGAPVGGTDTITAGTPKQGKLLYSEGAE